MSVVFDGQATVMINRHGYMGDGICITFPDCIVFSNTGGKYSAQLKPNGLIGTDYESVADAYIAAQVHLGKLILEEGFYRERK